MEDVTKVNAGNTIGSSDEALIDDEIKAKYFLQSRDDAGVISQLVKILNDFTMAYDKAKKEMVAGKEALDSVYVRSSAQWDKGFADLTTVFNDKVQIARQDASNQVTTILDDARTMVKTIMTKPVTDEMMNTIKMIGDVIPVDRMTKLEILTYIESCKGNYLATKAVMQKTHATEKYMLPFVSADDMMDSLDEITARAVGIIKNYHGDAGYEFATALQGDYFRHISTAYDKFMELYK